MTPGKASAKGDILIIDHPIGGRRYAAHVFDLQNGLAFMDHGWADPYPGSGQPCHQITGDFEEHSIQGGGWICIDHPDGDVHVEIYRGTEVPDGTREAARSVLQRSLGIQIVPD
jgi:hypothetical protein